MDLWAQSITLACEALRMRAEAEQAIKEARQMREYLKPQWEQIARASGHSPMEYPRSLLTRLLDAAMEVTGADMGNIQLFDPARGALRIEVQRGFKQPFLEFFDCVHDGQAACGTAFKNGRRVIVEDVAESSVFLGTPALEVMLDAGARAVQSTPLVGRSGNILGMVSTHQRKPRRPDKRDLFVLDVLARDFAESIEALNPSAHAATRASAWTHAAMCGSRHTAVVVDSPVRMLADARIGGR